jgi:hypothetical protein
VSIYLIEIEIISAKTGTEGEGDETIKNGEGHPLFSFVQLT